MAVGNILSKQSNMQRLDAVRPRKAEPTEYDGTDLTTLKPKMKAFARAYMSCWNGAQACREVGYNESGASRLLARPDIIAYMKMLAEVNEDENIASAKEVLEFATALLRQELTEEAVTKDGDTITKGTDLKDAVSAMNFLGKFHGIQKDVVEVKNEYNIVVDIDESFKGLVEAEEVEGEDTDEPYVEADFTEVELDEGDESFLDVY